MVRVELVQEAVPIGGSFFRCRSEVAARTSVSIGQVQEPAFENWGPSQRPNFRLEVGINIFFNYFLRY